MDAILGDHSFDSSKDEFSCSQDGIAYSENSEVSDYGSESSPSPDLIVLTPEDLVTMMKTELEKFCDVTNLTTIEARSLLNRHKWDRETLLDRVYAGGERAEALIKTSWKGFHDINFDCGICLEAISDVKAFLCNHRFCVECLCNYMNTGLKESGLLSNGFKCPGFQCDYELDDDTVYGILRDPILKSKYQQAIADSFVQNNKLMKWCPSASCQNAIMVSLWTKTYALKSVRCSCGCNFCFECLENNHDPVPCSVLKDWMKLKTTDIEAKDWILHHTKPCPKCDSKIEKNGGCMHMTCRKCLHEFCWICGGDFKAHLCTPNRAVSLKEDVEVVRRFSGYNAKHQIMEQALKLDIKLYSKRRTETWTMLEVGRKWINVEFVAEAIEKLLQCRRALMYSYIFSYFMTSSNSQMCIFEDNVKFLETSTEQLSAILEKDVTAENVLALKEVVIDKGGVCSKRRENLVNHVKEGYERNWWFKFSHNKKDNRNIQSESQ